MEIRGGGKDDYVVKRPLENIFIYFWKLYPKVFVLGISAILFCIVCLIFKCSSVINIPDSTRWIRVVGEFSFNISISLIAAEIFFIFQIIVPEHKKAPALNNALCEELRREILTPCFELRIGNYKDNLDKSYQVRKEIVNSIQKIIVVYAMPDNLFDTLMNLKSCGYLEEGIIGNTEDYIWDYRKTGKELIEDFDSYRDIILQYCREHQEWIRVGTVEYEKVINKHQYNKY